MSSEHFFGFKITKGNFQEMKEKEMVKENNFEIKF